MSGWVQACSRGQPQGSQDCLDGCSKTPATHMRCRAIDLWVPAATPEPAQAGGTCNARQGLSRGPRHAGAGMRSASGIRHAPDPAQLTGDEGFSAKKHTRPRGSSDRQKARPETPTVPLGALLVTGQPAEPLGDQEKLVGFARTCQSSGSRSKTRLRPTTRSQSPT